MTKLPSRWLACILFALLALMYLPAYATQRAVILNVSGAIGPATQDYVQNGIRLAQKQKAELVLIQLDTQGGLDLSMRAINQTILSSTIPVIVFVAPSGARAASAGTFILYAAHIAAMAPGTNIGAASPVKIGGIGKDSPDSNDKTLATKVMNDAVAYIRALAQLRGRNAEWAEQAVRKASTLTADEAAKKHVIDVTAENIPDLFKKLNGKLVLVNNVPMKFQTQDIKIEVVQTGWRYKFLSIITDPNIAYILLLAGIYGLFFEFMSPGLILPGAVGVISLLLALYAFGLLPVNYTGLTLLLVGLVFMVSEGFVTSYGILGIGGVVAFIIGSIFLYNSPSPYFRVAWQVITAMSIVTIGFFVMIVGLTIGSLRKKILTGREGLIGMHGEVIEFNTPDDMTVRVSGELWHARADQKLNPGQKVRVVKVSGLIMTVEPKE